MTSAVVFAYHNVGARCLRVLLAHGVQVALVVTHEDDPTETLWFERVAGVAADYGLPCIAPADGNAPEVIARVGALAPDFLFSFYYRRMLSPALVGVPRRGALNMHGSLLPKYRGRAPVNWAILHGESHTGATLHYMTGKPDAGDIVAQQSVPILPDDTAREVFDKVTVAAEIVLDQALPTLIAGTVTRRPNRLAEGSYFGGRRPQDGAIDWQKSARDIHNLVRAIAPPYPGAFTTIAGRPARILRTRVVGEAPGHAPGTVSVRDDFILAAPHGGGELLLLDLEVDAARISAREFARQFGRGPITLDAARLDTAAASPDNTMDAR